VKEEDLEAYRTQVRIATADVVEKKAGLEMAELNLRDAYVRSPVAGVVQTRQVQTGQYVQPGSVLATMIRREPLLLRFRVPEPEAAPLRTGQRVHFNVRGEQKSWSAEITHVAASASLESRMVEVTARVDDPDRDQLRPGAFAQVAVPIGEARPSPVIPQTAVRPSERGFLAFVVEDSTARERILTLGLRTEDGRVEVRSGLSPGETLVIRGAEALRDGASVRMGRVAETRTGAAPDSVRPAGGGAR
jgi:multidrug efflux system membrane fusion protein